MQAGLFGHPGHGRDRRTARRRRSGRQRRRRSRRRIEVRVEIGKGLLDVSHGRVVQAELTQYPSEGRQGLVGRAGNLAEPTDKVNGSGQRRGWIRPAGLFQKPLHDVGWRPRASIEIEVRSIEKDLCDSRSALGPKLAQKLTERTVLIWSRLVAGAQHLREPVDNAGSLSRRSRQVLHYPEHERLCVRIHTELPEQLEHGSQMPNDEARPPDPDGVKAVASKGQHLRIAGGPAGADAFHPDLSELSIPHPLGLLVTKRGPRILQPNRQGPLLEVVHVRADDRRRELRAQAEVPIPVRERIHAGGDLLPGLSQEEICRLEYGCIDRIVSVESKDVSNVPLN
ncbi:MAG: hypothetical protein HW416_1266 [Chloroflexi bacterium]|nr:hypothetical protein [Chloroflexota bacterium]